jgi:OOP family OmpA-OmpF porin
MATTTMTKISAVIASSLACVTLAANAATPGAYVGVGLGYSKINAPSKSMFQSSNSSMSVKTQNQNSNIGGKLFAGYNFNQYFGLEAGYSMFASTTNKATVNNTTASAKYSMNAASLVGKAYLPVQQQFNLYALGGAAEVYSTVNYSNNTNDVVTVTNGLTSGSKTTRALRPVYGVGASYDVNSHVTTGLEFSHIQGKGNTNTSNKAIPSSNMLTLTAAYNFG